MSNSAITINTNDANAVKLTGNQTIAGGQTSLRLLGLA